MSMNEPPSAIRLHGLSKSFGATRALSDVNFTMAAGRVHALCGGNGSGKSTLIKILAGVEQADAGEIEIDGRRFNARRLDPAWSAEHGLHFVHQSVGAFATMTVADNLALGTKYDKHVLGPINNRRLYARTQAVLDRFEIHASPRATMGELSQATRTMVAIARALQHEDAAGRGVLVLDEPTASLPAQETAFLLDTIRRYGERGHTVLLVTHRLAEVSAVADDITVLRDGRHVETYPVQRHSEAELVRMITGQDRSDVADDGRRPNARARLRLEQVSAGPLTGIDLTVDEGEIVGIAGLLGSGRSSLLRALFGVVPIKAGAAYLDGDRLHLRGPKQAVRRGIGYVPEDRAADAAFPDMDLRENITTPALSRYASALGMNIRRERATTQTALGVYGVRAPSTRVRFGTLSGGNQQKVVLARWLELQPKLLLLDEPTQGVDVGARASVHALLRRAAAAGTTALVVSSDPVELVELCDRVIGVSRGRVNGSLSGAALTAHNCAELAHGLTRGGT